jgi:hypothetical protein
MTHLGGGTGRTRTPVHHSYLDALSLSAGLPSSLPGSKTSSPPAAEKDEGNELDLLVLGVTGETSSNSVEFALVRFRQKNAEAALALEILEVSLAIQVVSYILKRNGQRQLSESKS